VWKELSPFHQCFFISLGSDGIFSIPAPLRSRYTSSNRAEAWTLIGPLRHLYYLLFHTFCSRFAARALDHCPVAWPVKACKVQQSDKRPRRLTHRIPCYTLEVRSSPNHYPTTTVLNNWHGAFVLTCTLLSKSFCFRMFWGVVRTQLCKSKL